MLKWIKYVNCKKLNEFFFLYTRKKRLRIADDNFVYSWKIYKSGAIIMA